MRVVVPADHDTLRVGDCADRFRAAPLTIPESEGGPALDSGVRREYLDRLLVFGRHQRSVERIVLATQSPLGSRRAVLDALYTLLRERPSSLARWSPVAAFRGKSLSNAIYAMD
jgi:hypothetical protein